MLLASLTMRAAVLATSLIHTLLTWRIPAVASTTDDRLRVDHEERGHGARALVRRHGAPTTQRDRYGYIGAACREGVIGGE